MVVRPCWFESSLGHQIKTRGYVGYDVGPFHCSLPDCATFVPIRIKLRRKSPVGPSANLLSKCFRSGGVGR